MELEFDPDKDAINRRKHGLSLADAARIDLDAAFVVPDARFAYGEDRFRAYGWIEGRFYMLAFTMRGEVLRAISLRKANRAEVKRYGQRP
ncbi:MAG TPA: BrnT family toxin [Acetobacteraceae bacterium]|nr:BrnT family toxin [Acetobacteraceae bacterium]